MALLFLFVFFLSCLSVSPVTFLSRSGVSEGSNRTLYFQDILGYAYSWERRPLRETWDKGKASPGQKEDRGLGSTVPLRASQGGDRGARGAGGGPGCREEDRKQQRQSCGAPTQGKGASVLCPGPWDLRIVGREGTGSSQGRG